MAEDLNAMNRTELNTYATAQGVEHPESYATKAELLSALEQQGSQAGSESPSPEQTGEGGEMSPEQKEAEASVSGAGLAEAEAEREVERETISAPPPEGGKGLSFAYTEETAISGPKPEEEPGA